MKKIILGAAAIALLLFLIFYGWLYYRKYQSFLAPIHKDAGLIVRVNVDGILKTLAFDFLTAPGSYTKTEKKKDGKQKIETGLELTANVFLYNLKNQPPNTFFGYLKISDVEAFRKFLKHQFAVDTFEAIQKGISSASIDKFRTRVLFNNEAVVFAFSAGKTSSEIVAVMKEIIQYKNVLPPSHHVLSRLKDMDSHISFLDKAYEGGLDFAKGEIHLLSTISTQALNIPDKTLHKTFDKESSVIGWLDADLRPLFNQNAVNIKDQFNIHFDSLVQYTDQHIEFQMLKTVTQKDTVITYTYDDNFEKVEEKTVEEKSVPEVYLIFKNTNFLLPYLQRQKIVDEKLKLNKEIFPLFDLYGTEKGEYLELSSNQINPATSNLIESDQFLYLEIDFNKLRKQQGFSAFAKLIEEIDSLIVSGKKADANTGEIKGSLYLTNKDKNALQGIIPL